MGDTTTLGYGCCMAVTCLQGQQPYGYFNCFLQFNSRRTTENCEHLPVQLCLVPWYGNEFWKNLFKEKSKWIAKLKHLHFGFEDRKG